MALSINYWHSIRLSAHEGAPVARRSARPGPREGAKVLVNQFKPTMNQEITKKTEKKQENQENNP